MKLTTQAALTVVFRRIRKIEKSDYYLRVSVCLSVRMDNSAPIERIFVKFVMLEFFENLLRKLKLH